MKGYRRDKVKKFTKISAILGCAGSLLAGGGVDTVSGATYSSQGILEAVEHALATFAGSSGLNEGSGGDFLMFFKGTDKGGGAQVSGHGCHIIYGVFLGL